jgi:transcription antitermination protein NusB
MALGLEDRRRARAAALQMLYQWEIGRLSIDDAVRTFWSVRDGEPLTDEARALAERLARGASASAAEADPIIAASADNWRLDRMSVVDRLILRLAVHEFLHTPDTPSKVVINEAVELARLFSTDEAPRFVNGVLDGIRKKLGKGD